MSEAERKRRQRYVENRKKLIILQAVAIVIIALILFSSLIAYNSLNKTYYIDYTEDSSVGYQVQMKPNEFYSEEWQPGGKSYVSNLINLFKADFVYYLNMSAKNVNYDYTYRIDAVYSVIDSQSGAAIIEKTVPLKETVRMTQSSNNQLRIAETVEVDYVSYNKYVMDFIKAYDLKSVEADLNVIMTVDVIGSSNEFLADSQNRFNSILHIPLNTQTVNADYSTSLNNGEGKVLAYKNANGLDVLKGLAIGMGFVDLVLILVLMAFVVLTKNHDVNYTNKVNKLYSSYRSFIQKITNGFDTTGYQILVVSCFNDMLAIRDTIQSPVLMSENTDKTRTQFLIPTNTKILYLYEIKVDNYDDIYVGTGYVDDSIVNIGNPPAEEPKPEVPVKEEPAAVEPVVKEPIAEETASENEPGLSKEDISKAVADAIKESNLQAMQMENLRLQGMVSGIGFRYPCEQPPCRYKSDDQSSEALIRLVDKLIDKIDTTGSRENAVCAQTPVEEGTEIEQTSVESTEIAQASEDNTSCVAAADGNTLVVTDEAVNEEADEEVFVETDEFGNKFVIHFSKSVSARVIQASDEIKSFYSELKNHILSYKGVKCRTSWKHESYNSGRKQLFKLKIRGKTLLLYCALDPNNYEYQKYFHETAEAKAYADVPMLVRIKSQRALKRAKKLVDDVMLDNSLAVEPSVQEIDYVAQNPYESTRALIDRSLIKVLTKEAVIPDDERITHVQETPIEEETVETASFVDSVISIDDDDEGGWQSSGLKVSRSFAAKVIQLDAEEKSDYSDLKNHILSYKGVKARASWKCETYKRGKDQLVKLKVRGKMLLVYLALDPNEADYTSFNYELTDSKAYERVPLMVKVKGDRSLAKAKTLIDAVMTRFDISKDPKAEGVDYVAENVYQSSEALMDQGLLKILLQDKEIKINDRCGFTVAAIAKAILAEDKELTDIIFNDVKDPEYAGTKNAPATEVVSVVIPDKDNDVHRYDPDGEIYERGDKVLVPTTVSNGKRKVIRRATVTQGNHGVDTRKVGSPVGKIIGAVKRVLENMLSK